ncbi:MAG TPA: site-specific integrase [Pyrinomonadaceae bacterium]|jgi:integrase
MANDRSGYVYQNKNGAWYARTTITDASGKRRNIKRRARDKQDAKRLLKGILSELDAEGNKFVDLSKLTFNDLADFYSTHFCKSATFIDGKKTAGLRDVGRAKGFLVRFCDYFGKRLLREITYRDICAYNSMRLQMPTHHKRPPTIATMNRKLGVLRRIFNIGVREGWLSKNPLNGGESLISPASERRRERILTLEEEQNLLVACEHPNRKLLRVLIICLLDTGARKSELAKHLRWSEVCFASRTITIEGMTTKTLKTRQLVMTERMYQELSMLWEASSKALHERVFEKLVNERWAFSFVCKAAGIDYGSPYGITYHSFRHTAAVRLVKGQMPLQMVGRILGHSQPQTTYRYLSADSETIAQAAAIFESFQQKDNATQTSLSEPELVH